MNFFLNKPYIFQKLYTNLELSRNSFSAKALDFCKIFTPDVLVLDRQPPTSVTHSQTDWVKYGSSFLFFLELMRMNLWGLSDVGNKENGLHSDKSEQNNWPWTLFWKLFCWGCLFILTLVFLFIQQGLRKDCCVSVRKS